MGRRYWRLAKCVGKMAFIVSFWVCCFALKVLEYVASLAPAQNKTLFAIVLLSVWVCECEDFKTQLLTAIEDYGGDGDGIIGSPLGGGDDSET